jgi:hypothetical protein
VVLIFPASFNIIAVWVLVSFIFRVWFLFFVSGVLPSIWNDYPSLSVFCKQKKSKKFHAPQSLYFPRSAVTHHFRAAMKMVNPRP